MALTALLLFDLTTSDSAAGKLRARCAAGDFPFATDSVLREAEGAGRYRAEGAGFEPAVRVNGLRFSRPVHSTALPPLPGGAAYSAAAPSPTGQATPVPPRPQ